MSQKHDKIENGEDKEDFLIESIYILEKESGICLFEQNYEDFTKEGISADLISSFLSALLSFADEAFADKIQHVQFVNRKIIFEFKDRILFVIFINNKTLLTDFELRKIIEKIAEKFFEKYSEIIEDEQFYNVSLFNDFSKDIYEIVKKEPLPLRILHLLEVRKKFEKYVERKMKYFQKRKEKIENRIKKLKLLKEKKKNRSNHKPS
ncbi:MAG: hypothetical protein ACTSQP_13500 [Promethearchaeota archaeon]